MTCPTEERLMLFLSAPEETATDSELAEHIDSCPLCQRRVAERSVQGEPSDLQSVLRLAERRVVAPEFQFGINPEVIRRLSRIPFDLKPREYDVEGNSESGVPDRIGDYQIQGIIGRDVMGIVYVSERAVDHQPVVLRVLSSETGDEPLAVQQAAQNVAHVSRLSHPNLSVGLATGDHSGRPFVVFEYLRGTSLDQWIRERGSIEWSEAINSVLQAARGLAYAHQHRVVHRDVCPANLFRTDDGVVKVLNLGLSNLNAVTSARHPDLLPHLAAKRAACVAPEQAEADQPIDERADVYGLGCTLAYLLSGRPLFAEKSAKETLAAHCHAPIPSLQTLCPAAPPQFDMVFQRLVAKQPAARFQSMGEVIAALQPFVHGDSAISGFPQHLPSRRRNNLRVAALLIAVLGIIAAACVIALR